MSNTESIMWTEIARSISKMLRIAGYKVVTTSTGKNISLLIFKNADAEKEDLPCAFYSVFLHEPVAKRNKYNVFQLVDLFGWVEGLIKRKEGSDHE